MVEKREVGVAEEREVGVTEIMRGECGRRDERWVWQKR